MPNKNDKGAQSWHILCVYKDPEFINDVQSLPEPPLMLLLPNKHRTKYLRVADKYAVNYSTVFLFKQHGPRALEVINGKVLLPIFEPEQNNIEVIMDADIKRVDYIKGWEQIRKLQEKNLKLKATKRKPPEDPQLVYAIFKALKNKMSFRDILISYETGELEYYKGRKPKDYITETKIRDYYRKHGPLVET